MISVSPEPFLFLITLAKNSTSVQGPKGVGLNDRGAEGGSISGSAQEGVASWRGMDRLSVGPLVVGFVRLTGELKTAAWALD